MSEVEEMMIEMRRSTLRKIPLWNNTMFTGPEQLVTSTSGAKATVGTP